MSLTEWLQNDWLVVHRSSKQEIGQLFGVADRDLRDCHSVGLSADAQFSIAYNAALQCATAALAAAGYRAAREAHHYRVIQSLAFTLELNKATVLTFDAFRKKRNFSDYEAAGLISDQEAAEMIALAEELRRSVEVWIKEHYPDLL
jgi:hypothetical protein